MFGQLLGHSNYHSYNIKIAKLFGLEAAVYLNAVLSLDGISNTETGDLKIDRELISNVTTLSVSAQRDLDKIFSKIAVFQIISNDVIKLNYSALLSLFNSDYQKEVELIAPAVVKKKTKKDAMKDDLKTLVHATNGELRDAYSSWIDAVFERQGWMSKKSVEVGQELIDRYTERNLDFAIEILTIAAVGGYRDIQWAIDEYEKNKGKQKTKNTPRFNLEFEQRKRIDLAQEVF